MRVKILDCSLRDGAHINGGNFGKDKIEQIIFGLNEAKIDFIELGFLQNVDEDYNKSFFSSIKQVDTLLSKFENLNAKLGIMLRTDRCDFEKLMPSKYIEFVRIALYKEHLSEVKRYAKKLKDLGYKLFLNPIAVTKYSDFELKNLLDELVKIEPYAVSMVDTFGAFDEENFIKTLRLFDANLEKNTTFGIHLHQNLDKALCLAKLGIEELKGRNLIVDCSVSGMGRVPGNLQSELLASHLNSKFKAGYDIKILLELSEILEEFKSLNRWGYNPIYMHSALLNIDRSYPEFFEKEGFNVKNNLILQELCKNKAFGDKFSEEKARTIIKEFEKN